MYNLTIIKKMIRCFSPITNINKMDLYIVDIEIDLIYSEIYFIHLVDLYFIPYLSQKHFNI